MKQNERKRLRENSTLENMTGLVMTHVVKKTKDCHHSALLPKYFASFTGAKYSDTDNSVSNMGITWK